MKLPIYFKLFFIFFVLVCWGRGSFCQVSEKQALSVSQLTELAEKKRIEGDIKEATRFLNEAAIVCWENKNYQEAIEHFSSSSTLNKLINNESGIDKINTNLGMIYSDLLNFDKSLEYFQLSLQYRKKHQLKFESISTHINVSVVLNNLKKYGLAAEHLEQALKLATEMNDAQQMKSCYGMLAETYEKAGDETKTLHYFGLYRTFHEMIQKNKETGYKQEIQKSKLEALLQESESKNKDLELQIQQRQLTDASKELVAVSQDVKSLVDSLSKNELAVALLKKQNQVKEFQLRENSSKLEYQYTFLLLSLSAFLLAVALLIIVFRNNKSKQKTNELLNERNEEIKALSDNQDELVKERTIKLQSAFVKLGKRNHLLSQFSSLLSLTLTHPVSKIHGMITSLKSIDQGKAINADTVDQLLVYTEELGSIANDLLEVPSLNNIEGEEITNVSVPSVFSSVMNLLKDRISVVDAKVTIEYNGINSVKGIRAFVENILYKLVARSLTESNNLQTPLVTIKLLKLKGMACISVSDNLATGISTSIKEMKIDLLHFADAGDSIKSISLFLVQSQLEAMDGELEMDKIPGLGTVVRVFLPLADEIPN